MGRFATLPRQLHFHQSACQCQFYPPVLRLWFVCCEKRKMTIPRLELGISRVSGERVSHCTIQSLAFFSNRVFMRQEGMKELRI